jgi:hypothetical protein
LQRLFRLVLGKTLTVQSRTERCKHRYHILHLVVIKLRRVDNYELPALSGKG